MLSVSSLASYEYCKRKLFLGQILRIYEPVKAPLVKGNLRHSTYDNINKDRLLIKENWFTVADGVSSHGKAGGEAAQIAIDKIESTHLDSLVCMKDVKNLMFTLEYDVTSKCQGCTTFTSVFVKNKKTILMHTGDSECYLVYKDKIIEVTKPFTSTYQLFLSGNLKEEQIKRARGSNILVECLGRNGLVSPQIEVLNMSGVIGMILCSDGANYISPEKMHKSFLSLEEKSSEAICKNSREAGSSDDITVICIEF